MRRNLVYSPRTAMPARVEGAVKTNERALSANISPLAYWCAAGVACMCLLVVPYRIFESGYLNHVSGSWAALADDTAHGDLYRPLLSSLGYGGTRNFPLHIIVHGALVALGLPVRFAGHLISLLSAASVVLAGAIAFGRRGASHRVAWSLGLLTLASRTAIMGAAGIRGDLFPVALGLLGLALVPRDDDDATWPSALLLGLAVLAKPTLAWAPAGAVGSLFFARRWRTAAATTVLAGAVAGLGLVAVESASHGNMLASFKACASGGGFSLSTLLGAMGYFRPGDLVWILGGVGFTLFQGRRALSDPLRVAGLVCLPVTIFVFTSKGTHVNHLLDATVIGAIALGIQFLETPASKLARWTLVAGTVFGCAEAILLGNVYLKHGELDQAALALPRGTDPVLAEQPWIPVLVGERAFVVDSYNLLQTRRTIPAVNHDLLERIDHCGFRAIVLLGKVDRSPWWYDQSQFGPGFREHLLTSYGFSRVVGAHAMYLPRCAATALPLAAGPEGETVLERMERPNMLHVIVERVRALAHG